MNEVEMKDSVKEAQIKKPAGREFIQVKRLKKYFPVRGGLLQRVVGQVQALDDVSFSIREGETLGLVGESGCGKTTVGRTMLRLVEPTSGEVFLDGNNVFKMKGDELKAARRDMQIIFQDPYASLDPRMPIGESVMEGLTIHNIGRPKDRFNQVLDTLKKVGLEEYHARRYPHEFSGGQRQRIGIARALALNPRLVVADEGLDPLEPRRHLRRVVARGARLRRALQLEDVVGDLVGLLAEVRVHREDKGVHVVRPLAPVVRVLLDDYAIVQQHLNQFFDVIGIAVGCPDNGFQQLRRHSIQLAENIAGQFARITFGEGAQFDVGMEFMTFIPHGWTALEQ